MGNIMSLFGHEDTRARPIPFPKTGDGLTDCIDACRGGVVILSGCGGGCDVFGTVLLLHNLKDVAKEVVLVSLSFTSDLLLENYGQRVTPYMFRVDPGNFITEDGQTYFPEADLANAVGKPVFALSRDATVSQIVKAYHAIFKLYQCKVPKAIFLVDGGCDVLLTGDETGLGTPAEDMLHLRAMQDLPAQHKAVVAIGLNVDCGHGVVQDELDERVEALRQSGAVLFEQFLTIEREDAAHYCQVMSECNLSGTVVQSLTKAAIEGHRGLYTKDVDYKKAGRSLVPLTDQTATLFGFDFEQVAAGVKYLSRLTASSDTMAVCEACAAHREYRALEGLPSDVRAKLRQDATSKTECFGLLSWLLPGQRHGGASTKEILCSF